jgi:hypothetical protein
MKIIDMSLLEKTEIKKEFFLCFKKKLKKYKTDYIKTIKQLTTQENKMIKNGLIDAMKFQIMKFKFLEAFKELKNTNKISKKTLFSISDIKQIKTDHEKYIKFCIDSNKKLETIEKKYGFIFEEKKEKAIVKPKYRKHLY